MMMSTNNLWGIIMVFFGSHIRSAIALNSATYLRRIPSIDIYQKMGGRFSIHRAVPQERRKPPIDMLPLLLRANRRRERCTNQFDYVDVMVDDFVDLSYDILWDIVSIMPAPQIAYLTKVQQLPVLWEDVTLKRSFFSVSRDCAPETLSREKRKLDMPTRLFLQRQRQPTPFMSKYNPSRVSYNTQRKTIERLVCQAPELCGELGANTEFSTAKFFQVVPARFWRVRLFLVHNSPIEDDHMYLQDYEKEFLKRQLESAYLQHLMITQLRTITILDEELCQLLIDLVKRPHFKHLLGFKVLFPFAVFKAFYKAWRRKQITSIDKTVYGHVDSTTLEQLTKYFRFTEAQETSLVNRMARPTRKRSSTDQKADAPVVKRRSARIAARLAQERAAEKVKQLLEKMRGSKTLTKTKKKKQPPMHLANLSNDIIYDIVKQVPRLAQLTELAQVRGHWGSITRQRRACSLKRCGPRVTTLTEKGTFKISKPKEPLRLTYRYTNLTDGRSRQTQEVVKQRIAKLLYLAPKLCDELHINTDYCTVEFFEQLSGNFSNVSLMVHRVLDEESQFTGLKQHEVDFLKKQLNSNLFQRLFIRGLNFVCHPQFKSLTCLRFKLPFVVYKEFYESWQRRPFTEMKYIEGAINNSTAMQLAGYFGLGEHTNIIHKEFKCGLAQQLAVNCRLCETTLKMLRAPRKRSPAVDGVPVSLMKRRSFRIAAQPENVKKAEVHREHLRKMNGIHNDFANLPPEIIYDLVNIVFDLPRPVPLDPSTQLKRFKTLAQVDGLWGEMTRQKSFFTVTFRGACRTSLTKQGRICTRKVSKPLAHTYQFANLAYDFTDWSANQQAAISELLYLAPKLHGELIALDQFCAPAFFAHVPAQFSKIELFLYQEIPEQCYNGFTECEVGFLKRQLQSCCLRRLEINQGRNNVGFNPELCEPLKEFVSRSNFENLTVDGVTLPFAVLKHFYETWKESFSFTKKTVHAHVTSDGLAELLNYFGLYITDYPFSIEIERYGDLSFKIEIGHPYIICSADPAVELTVESSTQIMVLGDQDNPPADAVRLEQNDEQATQQLVPSEDLQSLSEVAKVDGTWGAICLQRRHVEISQDGSCESLLTKEGKKETTTLSTPEVHLRNRPVNDLLHTAITGDGPWKYPHIVRDLYGELVLDTNCCTPQIFAALQPKFWTVQMEVKRSLSGSQRNTFLEEHEFNFVKRQLNSHRLQRFVIGPAEAKICFNEELIEVVTDFVKRPHFSQFKGEGVHLPSTVFTEFHRSWRQKGFAGPQSVYGCVDATVMAQLLHYYELNNVKDAFIKEVDRNNDFVLMLEVEAASTEKSDRHVSREQLLCPKPDQSVTVRKVMAPTAKNRKARTTSRESVGVRRSLRIAANSGRSHESASPHEIWHSLSSSVIAKREQPRRSVRFAEPSLGEPLPAIPSNPIAAQPENSEQGEMNIECPLAEPAENDFAELPPETICDIINTVQPREISKLRNLGQLYSSWGDIARQRSFNCISQYGSVSNYFSPEGTLNSCQLVEPEDYNFECSNFYHLNGRMINCREMVQAQLQLAPRLYGEITAYTFHCTEQFFNQLQDKFWRVHLVIWRRCQKFDTVLLEHEENFLKRQLNSYYLRDLMISPPFTRVHFTDELIKLVRAFVKRPYFTKFRLNRVNLPFTVFKEFFEEWYQRPSMDTKTLIASAEPHVVKDLVNYFGIIDQLENLAKGRARSSFKRNTEWYTAANIHCILTPFVISSPGKVELDRSW
ncbi:hypothetical protein QR680_003286 [Steinernema hermaphroditum]|uniref:F-box domain-containing protein n=1 Tax=Steinernema hermaphroditum TaxID=289476 RepID=A0AA39H741_9BILA|nr:hypothetical protein QR680_003286 [Steinernema hermaphroditum]